MTTPLGDAVQFLKDFGLFDIVLPFLLVFAVVFAILEKTKVLGTEKISGEEVPKKGLNAMVAFVTGMLVIAMNEVVQTLNQALPNVVLILFMIISFLMLVGVFYKEGEFDFANTHKGWTIGFMVVILILIVLVFLNSLYTAGGVSWLDVILDWIFVGTGTPVGATIIFLILVIIGIMFVVRKKSGGDKE